MAFGTTGTAAEGSAAMSAFHRQTFDRRALDRHAVEWLVADGRGVCEAIAPALRVHFADVTREPVPAHLAALLHKLEAEPDQDSKGRGTRSKGDETHGTNSFSPK